MNSSPKTLEPGAYWYVVPGKDPVICEKREGEGFVRFTNGGRLELTRDGESFVGPLPVPVAAGFK